MQGTGGNGGAGAGGAGGMSVGIVYNGAAPTFGATFLVGSAGHGGIGGRFGVNDGPNGLAGEIVQVP